MSSLHQSNSRNEQVEMKDCLTENIPDSCPLCGGLTDAEREAVESLLEPKEFESGAFLIKQGEADQALWILLSGRATVMKTQNGNEAQELATLHQGSVCGEMSFFRPGPHSATVCAQEPVRAAQFTLAAFSRLREICPSAAFKMLLNIVALLSERLRAMDERVCGLIEENCDEHRSKEWQEFRSNLFATWDFS